MAKQSAAPVGSRWQANGTTRVFVVIERLPFGRLLTNEEGRAYCGEVQQKVLLEKFTRL